MKKYLKLNEKKKPNGFLSRGLDFFLYNLIFFNLNFKNHNLPSNPKDKIEKLLNFISISLIFFP